MIPVVGHVVRMAHLPYGRHGWWLGVQGMGAGRVSPLVI
jgi:hypothetical protein